MSSSSSSLTTSSFSDQKAFVVRLLEEDDEESDQLVIVIALVDYTRRLLLEQAPDEGVQKNLKKIASYAVELLNKWCKDEPEKSFPPWFKQELDTLTQSKSLQSREQLRSLLSRTQHVKRGERSRRLHLSPQRDARWKQNEIEYNRETGPMSAFHNIQFQGSLHLSFLRAVIDRYEPLYLCRFKLDGSFDPNVPKENTQGFRSLSYGQIIHIVQSSGTGKSRLINELFKVVPGISVCLREVRQTTEGYPFGDDPVTIFLTTPRKFAQRQVAASLFIGYLLDELATAELKSVDENCFWIEWSVKGPGGNHATADPAQQSPFSLRRQFFTRVVNRASAECDRLAERGDLNDDLEAQANVLCDLYCKEPARRLADRISEASPEPDVPKEYHEFLKKTFFLAIDEASLLAETPLGVQLTHLRRALFAISSRQTNLRIWAVLMDTNSGITEVVRTTLPSAREHKHTPLPPWSRFAYDVFPASPDSATPEDTNSASLQASKAPQQVSPEDLVTLSRLSKFGRPLWGYTHSHGSSLVHFAMQKLLCAPEFDPRNIHHVVAVWSNRVCLDFVVPYRDYKALDQVQTQEEATDQPEATAATTPQVGDSAGPSSVRNTGTDQASQGLGDRRYDRVLHLVTNGVRAHMRIFLGLRPSGFIDTKLLSEPILTLGAITALRGFRHGDYTTSLQTLLVEVLERGKLLPCGQIGEFFCQLVSILARDVTLPETVVLKKGESRVSLFKTKDFLKTLLGTKYGLDTPEAIELERLDTPEADELERLVGDSVMCFTHFTVLDEAIPEPVSQHTLRNWFSRTEALQCSQRQAGIDAILPVYYPSTKSYSYLGISAKLRTHSTTPTYKVRFTEEEGVLRYEGLNNNCWGPKVTLADGSFERPLVILADLGATTARKADRVSLWQDSSLSSCTADETRALNDHIAANQLSSTRTDAASLGIHANDAISKETLKNLAAHGKGNECNRDFAVLHVIGFSETLAVLEQFHNERDIMKQMLTLNVRYRSVIDTYLDELDRGKNVRRGSDP